MKTVERLFKRSLIILTTGLLVVSTAQATNGIFTTLETGIAKQSNLPLPSSAGAVSLDNNLTPLALRFSLGYNHDITSYLGLGVNVGEGIYGSAVYHYPDGAITTVKSENLEILSQLSLHVKQFDIIPKIGGAREATEVHGRYAPDTDHFNNFMYGLEFAYNFSQRLAVTGTYAHVYGRSPQYISEISNRSVPIDEYLLGLRYTFAS